MTDEEIWTYLVKTDPENAGKLDDSRWEAVAVFRLGAEWMRQQVLTGMARIEAQARLVSDQSEPKAKADDGEPESRFPALSVAVPRDAWAGHTITASKYVEGWRSECECGKYTSRWLTSQLNAEAAGLAHARSAWFKDQAQLPGRFKDQTAKKVSQ